jgi:hypothetical protein
MKTDNPFDKILDQSWNMCHHSFAHPNTLAKYIYSIRKQYLRLNFLFPFRVFSSSTKKNLSIMAMGLTLPLFISIVFYSTFLSIIKFCIDKCISFMIIYWNHSNKHDRVKLIWWLSSVGMKSWIMAYETRSCDNIIPSSTWSILTELMRLVERYKNK